MTMMIVDDDDGVDGDDADIFCVIVSILNWFDDTSKYNYNPTYF